MANSVYQINKGINKSIEFKGLKAQYIWYLGGGLLVLLFVYAVLYICRVPSYICIGLTVGAGSWLFTKVYAMSRKYGEYGLMKAIARKHIPPIIKLNSRKVFMKRQRP